jgi:ferredoxin
MRIAVDHQLCEGNGECMKLAPEVFVVGDDDRAHLLLERPGDALRAKVEAAVRRCPRQALSLRDD